MQTAWKVQEWQHGEKCNKQKAPCHWDKAVPNQAVRNTLT